MKNLIVAIGALFLLMTLASLAIGQEASESGGIDFGSFTPSEQGTFVEIKVNKSLISMAARITQDSEPELSEILGGLNSIRVNVMEYGESEASEIQKRMGSIRSQLDERQWERVVTVKDDEADVVIYARVKAEEALEGLVVTVIESGNAVLVHVDGRIRPEELARVGERLNLPPLENLGDLMDQKR